MALLDPDGSMVPPVELSPSPDLESLDKSDFQHDAQTALVGDPQPLLPVPITIYRLLSSATLLTYGLAKVFALRNVDSFPRSGINSSDFIFAILFIVWTQWMGYFEAARPKMWISFFHKDHSRRALRFIIVDAGIVLFGALLFLAVNASVKFRIKHSDTNFNSHNGKFVRDELDTTIQFWLHATYPEAAMGKNRFPFLRFLLPASAGSIILISLCTAYVADKMLRQRLNRPSAPFNFHAAHRTFARGVRVILPRRWGLRAWLLLLAVFLWLLLVLQTHRLMSSTMKPPMCFVSKPKVREARGSLLLHGPTFYESYNHDFDIADILSTTHRVGHHIVEQDVQLGDFNHTVSLYWFDSEPDTFWYNVRSDPVCGSDTDFAISLRARFSST